MAAPTMSGAYCESFCTVETSTSTAVANASRSADSSAAGVTIVSESFATVATRPNVVPGERAPHASAILATASVSCARATGEATAGSGTAAGDVVIREADVDATDVEDDDDVNWSSMRTNVGAEREGGVRPRISTLPWRFTWTCDFAPDVDGAAENIGAAEAEADGDDVRQRFVHGEVIRRRP